LTAITLKTMDGSDNFDRRKRGLLALTETLAPRAHLEGVSQFNPHPKKSVPVIKAIKNAYKYALESKAVRKSMENLPKS